MNHSMEPWTFKAFEDISRREPTWLTIVFDEDGMPLDGLFDHRPNTERIVACVNACAGIPDKDGKLPLVGDMVVAILNNNPFELAAVKERIMEILEVSDGT